MQIEHSDFHDQLVRGLAHRMNNILSLFHGYLGLLMDGKELDSTTMDGLERIREGASAASDLMDRMKSLARPSSVIWRQISLRQFLETFRLSLESELSRGITLRIEAPEDLPEIWADTNRLKKVLREVVKNAIEASPANGVVLIEAATETAAPHGIGISNAAQPVVWSSLSVTDHGAGIPKGQEERIYQPFYSTKAKDNAMGLGLTVALGLVQQMGGVIRIASKRGNTVVKILLPSRSEKF